MQAMLGLERGRVNKTKYICCEAACLEIARRRVISMKAALLYSYGDPLLCVRI